MLQFPKEILNLIFSESDERSLCSVASTCRSFNKLTSDLPRIWKYRLSKKYGPIKLESTDPKTVFQHYVKTGKPKLKCILMGHVDSGKSTLIGHLAVLTGTVPPDVYTEVATQAKDRGRPSFFYSDILRNEKVFPQKTQNFYVFNGEFETAKRRLEVSDCSGMRDYITTMFSEATKSDLAIVMIAASIGEFEAGIGMYGQTREHILMAYGCGIKQFIFAVNKMDCKDVVYSEARYTEIVSEVSLFVKRRKLDIKYIFVPISSIVGDNLRDKSDKMPWYTGHTLLEEIDRVEFLYKSDSLLWAEVTKNKYSIYVHSGKIIMGQTVYIWPANKRIVVDSITNESFTNYAGKMISLFVFKVPEAGTYCAINEAIDTKSVITSELLKRVVAMTATIFTYKADITEKVYCNGPMFLNSNWEFSKFITIVDAKGNRKDGSSTSYIARQSAVVLMKPVKPFYGTERIVGTNFAWKGGIGTVDAISFE